MTGMLYPIQSMGPGFLCVRVILDVTSTARRKFQHIAMLPRYLYAKTVPTIRVQPRVAIKGCRAYACTSHDPALCVCVISQHSDNTITRTYHNVAWLDEASSVRAMHCLCFVDSGSMDRAGQDVALLQATGRLGV